MLVLRAFVRDGVFPLLGPPTSIGDFHHGALYYYLLAPGRVADRRRLAVGGGRSRSRSLGIAAVGVTWWLARSIGGPVAGAVAGLVMAVSASAIDESTFIWNPNLIALSSAVALAALVAGVDDRVAPAGGCWRPSATAVTMQCHVLGRARSCRSSGRCSSRMRGGAGPGRAVGRSCWPAWPAWRSSPRATSRSRSTS